MNSHTYLRDLALAAFCALTLAACEAGLNTPTTPSAVLGSGGAASNPDGSTLKVAPSVATFPLNNATGVGVIPTLVGVPGVPRSTVPTSTFAYRFQVSTTETFDTIARTGTGTIDSQGVARFTIDEALTTGTRYFWRLRAELEDQFGPWSNTSFFTTTGTVTPTARPDVAGERRTPNPPPGQRLPLPDMRGVLSAFGDTSDSCPPGRQQYILTPWLNRVIDRFRQDDTRWGYNAKPTRTAAQNGGLPVVAAGDEAAYNYTNLADEGNTGVHLVDMLVSHCGSSPQLGWRVFTGEEPGRWTGAGRF